MLAICIIHQTHTHILIYTHTHTQQWYLRVTRGVGSAGVRGGVRGLPTASATLAIYFMNANPCVHSGLLCFTHTHTHTKRVQCVCECVWEFQVFHIHFHSYRSFHSCTAKTESETELNWIFIIIMSVTRFSPQPSPLPYSGHALKLPLYAPKKGREGRGSEAKEKRILLAQFFLSSLGFLFIFIVWRGLNALCRYLCLPTAWKGSKICLFATHTHPYTLPHTHTRTHMQISSSSVCILLFLSFCVFYFVRESKFVVVELSTRQKSWLCATPPPDYAFV